jgi:DNA polymerase III subunit beta
MIGSGMKVSCAKDELVAKLAVVARGVSTRTTVQILSGIRLEADTGTLTLSATDMELSLKTSLEAQVDGSGATVVPGRLLAELSRLLPEGEVELAVAEDGVLRVTCGTASYSLHTYAAEDFPRLPEIESASLFSIDREAFLDTVGRVSRAASRDESRPVLTGILVRFEEGKLVMAATDSYRLAVKETPVTAGVAELEALVPARALAEVQRLAASAEQLDLGVLENQVVFDLGGTTLTTRRIDGQFPNYRALLPETFETEVSMPRDEFLEVVRRTAVMAQRNSPLRLCFGEGELTITARTPDIGEATESMPAPYTGEPLEIGFNAEFLRDGVESIEGDDVRLKLISPLRPAVLQGGDDDFTYLIMPIRLAG